MRTARREPGDFVPSDRFLRVLVEGLQDDSYPYGRGADGSYRYTPVRNATDGYNFLRNHPVHLEKAVTHLRRALRGPDGQQRLLAALLLAQGTTAEPAQSLVSVLVPHLRDNDLGHDAGLALYALHRMGHKIDALLQPYLYSDDQQQVELVRDLLDPAPNKAIDHPGFSMIGWEPSHFPNAQGIYTTN
jgi:hypothetical protein